MKNHMTDYKHRLEKGICDYMEMPVSERSATAIHSMFKALRDIDRRLETTPEFTYDDACAWAKWMKNDDGTYGAHWTIDQTSAVAESVNVAFDHIYAFDWWITMNMMYSDYAEVAKKFGVGTPEFFADMAKAFLFDPDGPAPKEKLSAYYHGVVCREK